MTITLALTTSPKNYATKEINNLSLPITIIPYDSISVINPMFIIDYNNTYLNTNYASITWDNGETFYYFVTVHTNNGGQLVLTCKRDVLSSFIDSINECECTVTRYEQTADGRGGYTKIPDNKLPILPNEYNIYSTIATNGALSNSASNSYVLTVVNGGVNL